MATHGPEDSTSSKWNLVRRTRLEITKYLAEGSTPEMLALAVALGVTGGLFPIYGMTTAVSFVLGIVFRANPVVVQVFNYMMYLIYFPIELGFILVGALIFEGGYDAYSLEGLRSTFSAGLLPALQQLGRALLHAVAVWAVVAPFLAWGLKSALTPVIRRWR